MEKGAKKREKKEIKFALAILGALGPDDDQGDDNSATPEVDIDDLLSRLFYLRFLGKFVRFRNMNKKTLTKSQRRFVAREKGRIRREFSDAEKQGEEIKKISNRFLTKLAGGQVFTVEKKVVAKKDKAVKTAGKSPKKSSPAKDGKKQMVKKTKVKK